MQMQEAPLTEPSHEDIFADMAQAFLLDGPAQQHAASQHAQGSAPPVYRSREVPMQQPAATQVRHGVPVVCLLCCTGLSYDA